MENSDTVAKTMLATMIIHSFLSATYFRDSSDLSAVSSSISVRFVSKIWQNLISNSQVYNITTKYWQTDWQLYNLNSFTFFPEHFRLFSSTAYFYST